MTDWKDVTTYCKYRAKEKKSSVWEAKIAGFSISVTKSHISSPGTWVMHCRVLGIDTYPLGLPDEATAEAAQSTAVSVAMKRVKIIEEGLSDLYRRSMPTTPNR